MKQNRKYIGILISPLVNCSIYKVCLKNVQLDVFPGAYPGRVMGSTVPTLMCFQGHTQEG